MAMDGDATLGRFQQRGQHALGGRLARPVGSQEAKDLPLAHLKVDVVHGQHARFGAAVDLGQVAYFDSMVHQLFSSSHIKSH